MNTVWKVTCADGSTCHFGTYGAAKAYARGGKVEEVHLAQQQAVLKVIDSSGEIASALVAELMSVVNKYGESMLLTTAIGCVELVKRQLIEDIEDTENGD